MLSLAERSYNIEVQFRIEERIFKMLQIYKTTAVQNFHKTVINKIFKIQAGVINKLGWGQEKRK